MPVAGRRIPGMPVPAGTTRCLAWVRVGTTTIRVLFDRETPPVPADEWDEAGYVAARLHAYADALQGLALLRPLVQADDPARTAEAIGPSPASGDVTALCPRTGDLVYVRLPETGDRAAVDALRDDVARALRRVFADANAWRRHLKPAYFARHRAWRALAGSPIQH